MGPWEEFKARFGKGALGQFQRYAAIRGLKKEAQDAFIACTQEFIAAHTEASDAGSADHLSGALKLVSKAKILNERLSTLDDGDEEGLVNTAEALLDAVADVTLELRVAQRKAKGDVDAFSGLDCPFVGRRALELEELYTELRARSPEVAEHLNAWLPKVKIAWSDTTHDAHYDTFSRVITLPTRPGVSASDIIDALLFETCNVENEEAFKELDGEYRQAARATPMPAKEYGRRKSDIEAMSVAKNVALLVSMMESGAEVAYQGQRNMLAMLKSGRTQRGETVADYQALVDDPARLLAFLQANLAELSAFLKALNDPDDAGPREGYLELVATSTHNSKATDPWDVTGLSTEDLYVAELLEKTKPYNIGPMIIADIRRAGKLDQVNVPFIKDFVSEAFVKAYVRTRSNGGVSDLRVGLIIRAVEDLFTLYPVLKPEDLPSVLFSDRLKALGAATLRHGLDDAYETDDQDPEEALQARRLDYEKVTRNRVLEGANDLRRAVQAALAPAPTPAFDALVYDLDVDSGSIGALKTRAEALLNEVRRMPTPVVAECGFAMRVMSLAIRDLAALDG